MLTEPRAFLVIESLGHRTNTNGDTTTIHVKSSDCTVPSLSVSVSLCLCLCLSRLRRLNLTWWGCCGLCFKHKPVELFYSFLFCPCVYFCIYGPFTCMSFHKFLRHPPPPLSHSVLPVLSLPYWSFQLYESLPQP